MSNEADLWKSEDTWNLMPLKPEIFNISAPMGESDMISYMPNKQGGSNKRAECEESFICHMKKRGQGRYYFHLLCRKTVGRVIFFQK